MPAGRQARNADQSGTEDVEMALAKVIRRDRLDAPLTPLEDCRRVERIQDGPGLSEQGIDLWIIERTHLANTPILST